MGDGFIRVWVKVDISKPLCRGRVLSLENGKELWVSFKYEQLPNLCCWCYSLIHDNQDCELWIENGGTLHLRLNNMVHGSGQHLSCETQFLFLVFIKLNPLVQLQHPP